MQRKRILACFLAAFLESNIFFTSKAIPIGPSNDVDESPDEPFFAASNADVPAAPAKPTAPAAPAVPAELAAAVATAADNPPIVF